MYSNIDSNHGIEVARKFLNKFKNQLPKNCPTEFLIETLEIVMKENIFQFGDTFWLQLMGCAMGTSAAVNYSYTYIGLLEMSGLLQEFKKYLLFYRRFIDDGIGVWNHGLPDSDKKFKEFFKRLNDWGKLRWTCTGFVPSLEFMDLTISIKNNKLHFKTFQKKQNLYLYIPPLSAHPKEMIRGLIFGRLRTYYKHNTNIEDYYNMALLLADRLLQRGWEWKTIKPHFREAHYQITGRFEKKQKIENKGKPIFIHINYHPRGIQRNDLRSIYNETLAQEIPNKVIIAVSRPKNLRDRLCRSRLQDVPHNNPSDIIQQLK